MDATHMSNTQQARRVLQALHRELKILSEAMDDAPPERQGAIVTDMMSVQRRIDRLSDYVYGGLHE